MAENRRFDYRPLNTVTRVAAGSNPGVPYDSDYLAGFLIDASGSTAAIVPDSGGRSILQCECDALMDALESMRGANNVSRRLRVTVRVFSGSESVTLLPLTLIGEIDMAELRRKLTALHSYGLTPMGKAITEVLRDMRNTRSQIINSGRRCGHPLLCVITDGMATDSEEMENAYKMVDALVNRPAGQPHLSLIPIGISQSASESFPQLKRLILHDIANEHGILSNGRDFSRLVRLIEQTQIAVERGGHRPTLRDILASDTPSAAGIRVTPQGSFGKR